MVDFQKIADSIKANPALTGAKVDTIHLTPREQQAIGNLLGKPTIINIQPQKEIASKEKSTYDGIEGMLIKYVDGTVDFVSQQTVEGKEIQYTYAFDNEKDVEKKTPKSKAIAYKQPFMNSSIYMKKAEETFKYDRKGKLESSELRNTKGELINTSEYDKNGKVSVKTTYDKNGEIKNTFKYKYPDENTQEYEKYDKDNKLELTGTIKTQDGKKVFAEAKYPDGKLASQSDYYENGKTKSLTQYYPNGQVKAQTEFYDNGVIKTQTLYDENGKITKQISPEIDGHFGESAQKSEGDCYLMATINSLRQCEYGQEILSNLIKVSTNEKGEKVYTVTLPGAKLAAEGLKTDNRIDNDTIAITGTYTFTESEMQEILKQAGKHYSLGDGDVILLEAAFEKYRQEVLDTLQANNLSAQEFHTGGALGQAGLHTGANENNILAGGMAVDAMFILTGQQSQIYMINPKNGLDYEDLLEGKMTVKPIPKKGTQNTLKAMSEVDGKPTSQKTELDRMLDEIMNDPKDGKIDKIAMAGFKTVHSDGKVGGHELTIKSVTEDTVTLINPWHPDKEVTMSREDFKNSVYIVTFAEPKKPDRAPEQQQQPQQPQGNGLSNEQISQVVQGIQNGTITPTQPSGQAAQILQTISGNNGNNMSSPTAQKKERVIPKGKGYTTLIKELLKEQGIEPTKENIKKAKEQFEEANPGKVHIYNGNKKEWKGNKYLIANDKVIIPEFKLQ